MAAPNPLSRLVKRADSVALACDALARRAMREIRGELANLSEELNLAGSSADREKVYAGIRRRMALLARRMNVLMKAQNAEAAKGAAKSAADMTGLDVRYSPSRAKAICELVTPAQGENVAAVFTDRMGRALINSLREATVGMLREQAVAGGSLKDMSRDLAARWSKAAKVDDPRFTDSSGRVWNTATYIQMNVRTNTMRVYNDCLADDVMQTTGSDLMRISAGGDPDCDCAAWEGCIVSLTGKTKGLPTYEDARNGGCFHPNCTHTLEYVDEIVDAQEIELQKSHPADAENADDYDAQDERKYQIDQARYMRDNPGMTQEEARVAVDRDNLEAAIRSGLVRGDAKEIVARMTDAQVTALCPDGNPPAFEPVKRIPGGTRAEPKYEPEKWNHGSAGGVVHVARGADAEHILAVCKVDDATTSHLSLPPSVVNGENNNDDTLPYLGDFKPASTITDALAYTNSHIGKVDFAVKDKDLGAINRFNEIMADAVRVHNLPKFTSVQILRSEPNGLAIVAGFNSKTNTLSFNPAAFAHVSEIWRESVAKRIHDGKDRLFACPSKEKIREYIGAHEAAHVRFALSQNPRKQKICETLLTAMNENGTLRTISAYARRNYRELFAELYALRHCGGGIPAEAESAIEGILR